MSFVVGGSASAEETREVAKETKVGEESSREDVSDRDQERAQQLFERGYGAYSTEKYGRALAMWRKAYEFVPAAVFLFNAAKAGEQLGNLEQALALAKRAGKQEKRPLPEKLAKKNETLIRDLKARLAFERKRREALRARKLDWRGWSGVAGLAGGTLAVGLATAVFGNQAGKINQNLGNAGSREAYQERRTRMESKQTVGRVLLYSGAGVAAVGGGLLVWDLVDVPRMPEDPTAAVRFGVNGRPGATIRLRF